MSTSLLLLIHSSITADSSNIDEPLNISLLCVAAVLAPAFVIWMHYQTKKDKPALIPNTLWRDRVFTSVCLSVFFTWGSFNSFEQLLSLWLQLVQHNDALQTSIRFLPQTVVGVIVNGLVGVFVHRFQVFWIIVPSIILSLSAPILMGCSGTHWSYWAAAFPAISLNVVGADVLYTIANLLISSRFPDDAQGLTGGVFNTMAQVGKSVGLALSAVISNAVAKEHNTNHSGDILADSYRAGIWLCLAMNIMTLIVAVWGLRSVGKISHR